MQFKRRRRSVSGRHWMDNLLIIFRSRNYSSSPFFNVHQAAVLRLCSEYQTLIVTQSQQINYQFCQFTSVHQQQTEETCEFTHKDHLPLSHLSYPPFLVCPPCCVCPLMAKISGIVQQPLSTITCMMIWSWNELKLLGEQESGLKYFTRFSLNTIYTLLRVSSPASSSSSSAFSGTFYECPLWQRTSLLLGQRTLFVRWGTRSLIIIDRVVEIKL